ncbi:unnamed protein product [Bursaphelenchus xylophilus]|nr:unnamed protein product [Bursaphelenchus xylophilus]CAG9088848.1 unnamed protein product [Bursaphelenchus xylophilus]
MLDSSSSGYRRMGGRSSPPRNVFFFGVLLILVVLFSVFFLYLSASNDVTTIRKELQFSNDKMAKLKDDLLNANNELEIVKNRLNTCGQDKNKAAADLEACTNSKTSDQKRVEELTKQNKDLQEQKTALEADLNAKIAAMKTVGVNQEAILTKQNETIDVLRRDLILKDELISMLKGQNKESAGPAGNPVQNDVPLGKQTIQNAPQSPPNVQTSPVEPQNGQVQPLAGPIQPTTKKIAQNLNGQEEKNPEPVLQLPEAQPGARVRVAEQLNNEADGALLSAVENKGSPLQKPAL